MVGCEIKIKFLTTTSTHTKIDIDIMPNEESRRIKEYVNAMSYDEIMQPPSKEKLMVELNILNPMVADVLDSWIRMRRMRIKEVEEAKAKFELLKQEVADLH